MREAGPVGELLRAILGPLSSGAAEISIAGAVGVLSRLGLAHVRVGDLLEALDDLAGAAAELDDLAGVDDLAAAGDLAAAELAGVDDLAAAAELAGDDDLAGDD